MKMINYICYSFIVTVVAHEVSADLPSYAHPHPHTMEEVAETNYVLLDKFDVCKSSRNSNGDLLIAIKTASMNRDRRDILRQTWLTEVMERRIPYVFVLGATTDENLTEQLLIEDKTYNDLLIGKPVDNYYNLTLKVMFLLAWTKNYCSTHWLFYVDDDTIVNIAKAIDFIALGKNKTDRVIYCDVNNQLVVRDPESKWFVPVSVWKAEYYPVFCSGYGYLIPPNTVPLLHQAAVNSSTNPKLWIDDVFITGIVTEAARIKLIQSPFQCCDSSDMKLFNDSVILGEVEDWKTFSETWKMLRGKLTYSIKARPEAVTSMTKMAWFNREGYLLTTEAQKSDKLFEFVLGRRFSHLMNYSLWLGIIFLMIMAFLHLKRCLFFGIFRPFGRSFHKLLQIYEKVFDLFKR